MGIFQQFPYSNFHEQNLDWVINKVLELVSEWNTFTAKYDKDFENMQQAISDFYDFIHGAGLAQEVSNKIDELKESGELEIIITNALNSSIKFYNRKIATLYNSVLQDTYWTQNRKSLQSTCYNSKLNNYVFLFSDSDNSTDDLLLVECDANFNVTRRVLIAETFCGHGNDITYDPNNDVYIVATNFNNGLVGIIDADTLSGVDVVSIDGAGSISQISYDSLKNIFFLTNGDFEIFTIDANYANPEKIGTINPNNISMPYETVSTVYQQGSECYNGFYIMGAWLYGYEGSYIRFLVTNTDGILITYADFESEAPDDELEGIFTNGAFIWTSSYIDDNININAYSLNEAIAAYTYPEALTRHRYTVNSTLLEDLHKQASNTQHYLYYITFAVAHPVLGGSNGFLEGLKVSDLYGYQKFTSVDMTAFRVMVNGTWRDWYFEAGVTKNSYRNYVLTDVHTYLQNVYADMADLRAVLTSDKGISTLHIKFKTANPIISGSVTLPDSVPGSRTESYGTLCSLDGKTGFIQINGQQLLIRCEASASEFLEGQIIYNNVV